MEEKDNCNQIKNSTERAIINFICITFDRYRYSLQDLTKCVAEIEGLLQKCGAVERYELLNSKYIDGPDRGYALSSLIRICINRIHNQCEIKNVSHASEIKKKIQSLCTFSCNLIHYGLNPMLPFWEDDNSNMDAINHGKVRIFNGYKQIDYWSYSIFSKLAESMDFSSDVNMADIYSLVFDIIASFEGDEHYPNLSTQIKPAILTLPIWKEDDTYFNVSEVRRRIFSEVHEIWICGAAFLSLYGGYSPCRGDFAPSVLKLALDKLSKFPDQKLFTFINMDTQNTTTDYNRLLPMTYDHQYVIDTQMDKSDAISTLKKVLFYAYNDLIVNEDGYYSHYSVIVYIFLIKEFYQNYKQTFCNKLKTILRQNQETIPLLYDIINQTINDYYFEDLSFVDNELERDKVITIFLTQLNKFSKEWQDWIDINLIPLFNNNEKDMNVFKKLLFEQPTIAQYVVTSYKNYNITEFILNKLYFGYLNFEQMVDILCNNGMARINVLKLVLNEDRIDFYNPNVNKLFVYVLVALILKSNYFFDEPLMEYILDLCQIYKGYNTIETMSSSLQEQYLTLCQFPSTENEKLAVNNIFQFLKALKKANDLFAIDFNRGFIECINFQNQHRPNMVVLKLLFDLKLLDQNICEERLYLQQSILSENPQVLSIINKAWPLAK